MPITRLDGKRKLGQNRATADILGAAKNLIAQHGDAVAVGQQMLEMVATERSSPQLYLFDVDVVDADTGTTTGPSSVLSMRYVTDDVAEGQQSGSPGL